MTLITRKRNFSHHLNKSGGFMSDFLTVNGKKYKIAKNYKEDIKLGDEGTFYLDIEGKIAAVDATKTLSSNYAYATKAGLTT